MVLTKLLLWHIYSMKYYVAIKNDANKEFKITYSIKAYDVMLKIKEGYKLV